jgi:hypothetical protein
MKNQQRGFAGFVLVIWLLFIAGWVMNIVQVFKAMPATMGEATPMFLAKAICIFAAPIGSVLGWIGLFS